MALEASPNARLAQSIVSERARHRRRRRTDTAADSVWKGELTAAHRTAPLCLAVFNSSRSCHRLVNFFQHPGRQLVIRQRQQ